MIKRVPTESCFSFAVHVDPTAAIAAGTNSTLEGMECHHHEGPSHRSDFLFSLAQSKQTVLELGFRVFVFLGSTRGAFVWESPVLPPPRSVPRPQRRRVGFRPPSTLLHQGQHHGNRPLFPRQGEETHTNNNNKSSNKAKTTAKRQRGKQEKEAFCLLRSLLVVFGVGDASKQEKAIRSSLIAFISRLRGRTFSSPLLIRPR